MDANPYQSPEQKSQPDKPQPRPKLPISAHFMCGWPLLLVFIGGAIGGGLGGAAYAVNIGIYKANLPAPVKVVLNLLVGFAAVGIWFGIAVAIHMARSG